MATISLFSPAKINLFLHIIGKRNDGYHDLQSVFRALDFGDWLHFTTNDGADDMITLLGDNLPCDFSDNLIIKAVKLLTDNFPRQARPITITLDKHIPTGAGLGGGSSNCATTLIAINKLWNLELKMDDLLIYGAALGADVPFFIFHHYQKTDAIALGIGEKLTAISLPSSRYLLVMPDEHLATADFFAHNTLQKNTALITDLSHQTEKFTWHLQAPFHNCFEPLAVTASAKVANALSYLRTLQEQADATARMTGTGSAVFLPISDDVDDKTLHAWQQASPSRAIVTSSLP
ncbi:4-(cytidine 5'-diphospho)-2-C-methyl-D-erythritol kinase [Moraxella nasovis]|uniref:4-(cytidine 5'-diphospho)-2-C-methyl-D-erythritol kinase n=1 Tax=Moraxella nasovis TaxID=2904121 RepID=UPI001F60FBC6|nr:4-(cytidine 5'-diphospho)-2-C-methyl-D-erythritol kinase [Moraxella nasovis]UNU72790.1 4-(cytidine 5'-diphospho)-2-C-methyl-D-erythritol kinase [Moraxella nasovis]